MAIASIRHTFIKHVWSDQILENSFDFDRIPSNTLKIV